MKRITAVLTFIILLFSVACYADTDRPMNTFQAAVIGVVEGITEYLPVSSTGHILVTQELLAVDTDTEEKKNAADAYAICIQLGAIVAVLGLYFNRFKSIIMGLLGKDKAGLRLLVNIIVAFIPAAVIGLILHKPIQRFLFGMWPIIAAWLVGGIFMLIISPRTSPDVVKGKELEDMEWKDALKIGLIQCISMWPGVSRSFSTIIGGIFTGMSVKASVEFSFLLGVITLGAATVFEGYKHMGDIFAIYGFASPIIGFIVTFVAAVLSIKWLVSYLNSHGMQLFGWYRIVIAVICMSLVLLGIIH